MPEDVDGGIHPGDDFLLPPFGIVGIVNAAKVSSLFAAGNVAAAEEASKSAGKWTKWGFIVGLVVIVPYAIFYVAMMPSV